MFGFWLSIKDWGYFAKVLACLLVDDKKGQMLIYLSFFYQMPSELEDFTPRQAVQTNRVIVHTGKLVNLQTAC